MDLRLRALSRLVTSWSSPTFVHYFPAAISCHHGCSSLDSPIPIDPPVCVGFSGSGDLAGVTDSVDSFLMAVVRGDLISFGMDALLREQSPLGLLLPLVSTPQNQPPGVVFAPTARGADLAGLIRQVNRSLRPAFAPPFAASPLWNNLISSSGFVAPATQGLGIVLSDSSSRDVNEIEIVTRSGDHSYSSSGHGNGPPKGGFFKAVKKFIEDMWKQFTDWCKTTGSAQLLYVNKFLEGLWKRVSSWFRQENVADAGNVLPPPPKNRTKLLVGVWTKVHAIDRTVHVPAPKSRFHLVVLWVCIGQEKLAGFIHKICVILGEFYGMFWKGFSIVCAYSAYRDLKLTPMGALKVYLNWFASEMKKRIKDAVEEGSSRGDDSEKGIVKVCAACRQKAKVATPSGQETSGDKGSVTRDPKCGAAGDKDPKSGAAGDKGGVTKDRS